MQYQLITTQNQLNQFVSSVSNAPILAIDTEFMRRRTLYPEVALIQVYDGSHLALIDPLCELDFTLFWHLLQDEKVLKVFHSPSEDIEVFQKFAGFVPHPMFDTQFALQLLGEGNCVGFASMVKKLLDVEIDKSESRTNWLQRPLTEKQLDYAASDVYFLLPCFEKIAEQISEKSLFDIIIQESQLIASKRAFEVPDDHVYLDIKNAWQLKPRDLAVLKELAAWRRAKAQKKNLALSFVLKELNMVEVAKRRPTTLVSLRNIPGIELSEVNRSGKEILQCVERGKAVTESNCPEKLLRLIDYPNYKKAAKDISAIIKMVAVDAGIPADVFASKKQINQLLSWNWKKTAEERAVLLKPDLLQNWRYCYVKKALSQWDV
ncbi:ribonuclease D [Pseudoalteromonas sp. MMG013]|uniref:ribonuclease D n=1 Tax=Pseudoalteromonas sp. MMG013 TaxID=2822687 RepID=UPI001B38ED2D|nr:ribonuclease D [Pseudoalteromonas sp. MMG013]